MFTYVAIHFPEKILKIGILIRVSKRPFTFVVNCKEKIGILKIEVNEI